ncbi:MAG: hypothetical protein EOO65_03650 [Methanosarcinales archaeon]|nr:MAG: hypothetical protein EOO65_03650 [Methanosarcinales archaeon]
MGPYAGVAGGMLCTPAFISNGMCCTPCSGMVPAPAAGDTAASVPTGSLPPNRLMAFVSAADCCGCGGGSTARAGVIVPATSGALGDT